MSTFSHEYGLGISQCACMLSLFRHVPLVVCVMCATPTAALIFCVLLMLCISGMLRMHVSSILICITGNRSEVEVLARW